MNVDVAGGAQAPDQVTASERSPRARGRLTRELIIGTALSIMDDEGLEALTMRRIGRALGVEAMSLYNHVADKEDILQSVCEEVLSEFRVPDATDWRQAVRDGAREYRRLLLSHPRVVTLMTEQKGPIGNLGALRAYEFALDAFRGAGISVEESVRAFHVFGGYILGFVTMELGPMLGGAENEAHAQAHEQMAKLLESADLPRMREAFPYLMDCDIEQQFEFGLDLLIVGLEGRAKGSR